MEINKETITQELLRRLELDQELRQKDEMSQEDWLIQLERDEDNLQYLLELVETLGEWPRISMVGTEASSAAYLIAQHAKLEYQEKFLPMMEDLFAEDPSEIKPSNIAYLTDRVRMYKRLPQLYGTQFKILPNIGWIIWEIEDPQKVNERREVAQMETFEANVSRMMDGKSKEVQEQIKASYKKIMGKDFPEERQS